MARANLSADRTRQINLLIPTIQYLREFAAMRLIRPRAREALPGLRAFFRSEFGRSGIDLLYVISGFKVATTRGTGRPLNFMALRLIRVALLYSLLTGAVVAIAWKAPRIFRTIDPAPADVVQCLFDISCAFPSFSRIASPVYVPE